MTSNKFERVQRLNMLKSIGFEDGALYGWTFDISLFYHEIRACQDIIRKCFLLPPRQLGYLSTEQPRRQHPPIPTRTLPVCQKIALIFV